MTAMAGQQYTYIDLRRQEGLIDWSNTLSNRTKIDFLVCSLKLRPLAEEHGKVDAVFRNQPGGLGMILVHYEVCVEYA